jgi:hypothetical protein
MGLTDILGGFKPESAFHDGFDEVAVVSPTDEDLEGLLVLGDVEVSVYSVGKIDHEEEFLEFVDLEMDAVVAKLVEVPHLLGGQGLHLHHFFVGVGVEGGPLGVPLDPLIGRPVDLPALLLVVPDEGVDAVSLNQNSLLVEVALK